MPFITRRRLYWVVATLAAALLLALLLRPGVLEVEVATIARGPLRVTVDDDGETRVRDRYVVSAPVSGRLERVRVDEGDRVTRGQLVAHIYPSPLDPRAREQAEARHASARAAEQESRARLGQAEAGWREATQALARAQALAVDSLISQEALDRARTEARTRELEREAAARRADAAAQEVRAARAALQAATPGAPSGVPLPLLAPADGLVLRVIEEYERVLPAGAPILDIGDPSDLEIVVDVLSTDAARIRPGALVLLDAGAGMDSLCARVRMVEPSGFTKVSPLGVEEQRVNVIGDVIDPPPTLGDRFRVEASITVWEGEDVIKAPSSALFRSDGLWSVFIVESGRARLRPVEVGERGGFETRITAGLEAGDVVITHPSESVRDGVRVRAG